MAVFTRNCNLTFKADKPIVCYVYNDDGLYAGDTIKSDPSPARKDTLYNNFNKDLVHICQHPQTHQQTKPYTDA